MLLYINALRSTVMVLKKRQRCEGQIFCCCCCKTSAMLNMTFAKHELIYLFNMVLYL